MNGDNPTGTDHGRPTRNHPVLRGDKVSPEVVDPAAVTLLHRIDHFTWANFTLTMATGGIAVLLAVQPHTFTGLRTLGKIVYILDLVLFVILSTLIALRFVRSPWRLKASFQHPTESLFFPTFFLSMPTIIGGVSQYGAPECGPWLTVVVRVLFWMFVASSFGVAVFQYWFLFTGRQLTVQSMTPAWLLPILPIMLSGTVATLIAPEQPPAQRLPILVAGATFQGLGFWTAILMSSVYIGMFIAVGPPSFTGLGLIGMSRNLPSDYAYFHRHPTAVENLQQTALVFAIFIWSLAFWFFCIALFSCLVSTKKMSFHLIWYAFIFPNTGFAIAVIDIGTALESEGVEWVGSVMSVLLVAMWLFVLVAHVRAILRREILWPGKDEDKDE